MADPVKPETKAAPSPAPEPKPPTPPPPAAEKVAAPVVAEPDPSLTLRDLREQVADNLHLMLRSDSYKERSAIANHILDLLSR